MPKKQKKKNKKIKIKQNKIKNEKIKKLVGLFGILERLLNKNPTNQNS